MIVAGRACGDELEMRKVRENKSIKLRIHKGAYNFSIRKGADGVHVKRFAGTRHIMLWLETLTGLMLPFLRFEYHDFHRATPFSRQSTQLFGRLIFETMETVEFVSQISIYGLFASSLSKPIDALMSMPNFERVAQTWSELLCGQSLDRRTLHGKRASP